MKELIPPGLLYDFLPSILNFYSLSPFFMHFFSPWLPC